jgi:stage III sporulation protein AH
MKFSELKTKTAELCRKIGKKNFIIIGAVLLTVVAVGVNVLIVAGNKDDNFGYDQSAGMDAGSGAGNGTEQQQPPANQPTEDTYFSSIQIDRQRTRDEAIEVLKSVVDNQSSTETAKNEALAQINKLADIMEAEANIETLIVAKGFSECVAVISDGSASIVVKCDGLIPAQISQINEIVYEQSGIEPVNVKIIER